MQVSFMFARFPGNYSEHPKSSGWIMETALKAAKDPRISHVEPWWKADTPITMVRNEACYVAREKKLDYILMIDSDMDPDCEFGTTGFQPFWESTLEFLLKNRHDYVGVGAPYCGPPPHENIYVFEWYEMAGQEHEPFWRLDQFSRPRAASMGGIQEVGALPTGLYVMDTRILDVVPEPWFDYEYDKDGPKCPHCGLNAPGYRIQKATTEDVFFTRNASILGCPQYCNWDAWAGHIKLKTVRKPQPWYKSDVNRAVRQAMERGINRNEKIITIGPKKPKRPPKDFPRVDKEIRIEAPKAGNISGVKVGPPAPLPEGVRLEPIKKAPEPPPSKWNVADSIDKLDELRGPTAEAKRNSLITAAQIVTKGGDDDGSI